MFLNQEELQILTGRQRRDAVIRALRGMRIEHVINAAGEPIVSTSHVDCK